MAALIQASEAVGDETESEELTLDAVGTARPAGRYRDCSDRQMGKEEIPEGRLPLHQAPAAANSLRGSCQTAARSGCGLSSHLNNDQAAQANKT